MFTVKEISAATHGKVIVGSNTASVSGVSIDSRQIKKGQLFIAIKGDIFDGHDFIDDVANKGVRVMVVHRPPHRIDDRVTYILVKDTTRALGDLARSYRLRFKVPLIAITGSAGKTTTKEMIASVLAAKFKVLKNEGTQNNHIGVPLTLLKLRSSHQVVVLECGTNQPGDIPWLSNVSRPTIAVFTNIGESHLEKLGSIRGVLKEKWTLTEHLPKKGLVVVNADDVLLRHQALVSLPKGKVVTYGIFQPCDVQANALMMMGTIKLEFTVSGKRYELGSCGLNNVYNSLAAIAVARHLGVPHGAIIKTLKKFQFPQGRGQIVPLGKGWLLNDVYNANPVSMRAALQTLQALAVLGRKVVVAGDMLELGKSSVKLHAAIGAGIASTGVSVLITVGELSRGMAREAARRNPAMTVVQCRDIEEAKKALAANLHNGDAVLIKGSRRMKMEGLVDFLLQSPQAALS